MLKKENTLNPYQLEEYNVMDSYRTLDLLQSFGEKGVAYWA